MVGLTLSGSYVLINTDCKCYMANKRTANYQYIADIRLNGYCDEQAKSQMVNLEIIYPFDLLYRMKCKSGNRSCILPTWQTAVLSIVWLPYLDLEGVASLQRTKRTTPEPNISKKLLLWAIVLAIINHNRFGDSFITSPFSRMYNILTMYTVILGQFQT